MHLLLDTNVLIALEPAGSNLEPTFPIAAELHALVSREGTATVDYDRARGGLDLAGSSPRRVALLSVHPRHAVSMLSGTKRAELRRAAYPAGASHVLLYSTAPVQRVVGLVVIDHVELAAPAELWDRHHTSVCVGRAEFDAYFAGCEIGAALVISTAEAFQTPLELSQLLPDLHPPQTFRYLSSDSLPLPFAGRPA